MKLRIKGDSLRLRFDQNELQSLKETGKITSKISFGPSNELIYVLGAGESDQLEVSFNDNVVSVYLPPNEVQQLIETDLVSVKREVQVGDSKILQVLVEKDFHCLTEREGEDESKSFPNPLADKINL